MAIKYSMDNGHENVYLSLQTNEQFMMQIKQIWYPMVLSFINEYSKEMIWCKMGN